MCCASGRSGWRRFARMRDSVSVRDCMWSFTEISEECEVTAARDGKSVRTPEVVAAATCAFRVAATLPAGSKTTGRLHSLWGKMASCGRMPSGLFGFSSPLVARSAIRTARIGSHITALRLNSISPTAKLAGDEIRRSVLTAPRARASANRRESVSAKSNQQAQSRMAYSSSCS